MLSSYTILDIIINEFLNEDTFLRKINSLIIQSTLNVMPVLCLQPRANHFLRCIFWVTALAF